MVFGYYMIACFDVLGQSGKLLEMARQPPDSKAKAVESLRETAGVVLRIRDHFKQFFEADTEFSASLPPDVRKYLFDHTKPRLIQWGFSDTYIVAIPITNDDKVSATVAGIYRTLCAASTMWLISLGEGNPLRGGIEIGLAIDIEPTEVYGPALVEAHRLESKVADYPRIVVGRECVRFLRQTSRDARKLPEFKDDNRRAAAKYASTCLRMLREIEAEHAMLDSLGDDYLAIAIEQTRAIFPRAIEQVDAQLRQARNSKDCKLIRRYEKLSRYFRENSAKWKSQ